MFALPLSSFLNRTTGVIEDDFLGAFLRSFIKRIEMNTKQVTVYYNLPVPQDGKSKEQIGVLPIDTLGGEGGIRTPTPYGT